MRYHFVAPLICRNHYGKLYLCNHPLYNRCTLYQIGNKGLAVIQQKFHNKKTWWQEIDSYLTDSNYLNEYFYTYFQDHAGCMGHNGCYPTVTVRQIMHALKMKPI